MKKSICIVLMLAVIFGMSSVPANALTPEPKLEAAAAILVDMSDGKVLFEKNADSRQFPASTTKMLTCLLALEKLDLQTVITADAEAAGTGGNTIKLKEGESMDLLNMLHGMMIPSANDASVAIAKAVTGSVESFASMMNARARELGCKESNFVNPSGIHDELHYSSARDLALIALECMKNETFRQIVAKYEYTLPATEKSGERELKSTNFLLNDTEDNHRIYVGNDLRYCKYEGTIGVKTGYTSKAGGCLVAACERNGTKLLSVVLGSSGMGRFADSIKVLDWGFENYRTITVLSGGYSFGNIKVIRGEFNKVEAVLLADIFHTLPMDASTDIMSARAVLEESLKAPVKKGDVVGEVTLYEGDEIVGTYSAVAAKSVAEGGPLSAFGIEDSAAARIWKIALAVLVTIVIFVLVIIIVIRRKVKINKAKKNARKRKREKQEAARRAEWERYYEGKKYGRDDPPRSEE